MNAVLNGSEKNVTCAYIKRTPTITKHMGQKW